MRHENKPIVNQFLNQLVFVFQRYCEEFVLRAERVVIELPPLKQHFLLAVSSLVWFEPPNLVIFRESR